MNIKDNEKIIIKTDDELNEVIDYAMDKFNIFENDSETNKLKISKGIVNIKEFWISGSKEDLLNIADFKEFLKENTNIEIEIFNITLD